MSLQVRLALATLRRVQRGLPVDHEDLRVAIAQLQGREEVAGLPPTGRGLMILRAIAQMQDEVGLPPTLEELSSITHLATSTIHEHVGVLVERGLLRRSGPRRSRNLRLTRKGLRAQKTTP
jgi:DNA-binding MarR family transcriptional regulator